VPHDVRDQVVDFVRRWSEKTEIGVGRFIHWLGVTASKLYDWRQRYGKNRALAQVAEERVYPSGHTALAGRCVVPRVRLR
jgi:hypothetical protein